MAPGTVVAHNYHDDTMPPGLVAPYQVRLDEDGGLIWAPSDDNDCIRVLCEDVDSDDVDSDEG